MPRRQRGTIENANTRSDRRIDPVAATIEDVILSPGSSNDLQATTDENNLIKNPNSFIESHAEKMLIQNFDGDTRRLSIDAWVDRYEMLAERRGFDDENMVIELGSYLVYEALEWYMSVMREKKDINFENLKILLLQRFGIKSVDPMSECVDLKYNEKIGMKNYFEQKRTLGMKAGLAENQIISLMIHGLPPNYSSVFNSMKPKSMEEFFNVAKRTENSLMNHSSRSSSNLQRREVHRSQNQNSPKNPCWICEKLGYPKRFHWTRDCWNKERDKENPQKKRKYDHHSRQNSNKALN